MSGLIEGERSVNGVLMLSCGHIILKTQKTFINKTGVYETKICRYKNRQVNFISLLLFSIAVISSRCCRGTFISYYRFILDSYLFLSSLTDQLRENVIRGKIKIFDVCYTISDRVFREYFFPARVAECG